MLSGKFCEICKHTFLHNTTGRLVLIIAVSIVVKEELANETVNYAQKLNHMYQFEPEVQVIKKGSPGEIWTDFRGSGSQIFFKIGALKNFANSTGKDLCWRHFFIKF